MCSEIEIDISGIERKLCELNDKNRDILSALKELNETMDKMSSVLFDVFLEIKYK